MSDYADLRARIDAREVIILDGAVGTQLQRMEVPMSHDAWAGIALETQSSTSVRCATHCPNDCRDRRGPDGRESKPGTTAGSMNARATG